ncbi:MAG: hypothetical protein ABIF18_01285 [archaeon]
MKSEYILVFLLGFFSCAFLFYGFSYSNIEVPFGTGLISLNSEAIAPFDRVSEKDIIIFDDMIILRVSNTTLSNYADTGSMKPVFDKGANGIRVVPDGEDDVNIGDIVSYRFGDILVVHRVIEKGVDGEGVYFIMQGDNNILSDGKIRFEDIEYVTIGVIW